ncbi:MAG: hypothetical protein RSA01_02705 [Clostridium sp.]
MEEQLKLIENLEKVLPKDSKILIMQDYYNLPAVIVADFDSDSEVEIAVAHTLKNQKNKVCISLIKYNNGTWRVIDTIVLDGIGITDLLAAATQKKERIDIIVGSKVEKDKSILKVFQVDKSKLKHILNEDAKYSKLEVGNVKSNGEYDGINEIALWNKDKMDAYDIEIYRIKDGRLVKAEDAEEDYFKDIVKYYEEIIEYQGVNNTYLYHLALSEYKSRDYLSALNTLNSIEGFVDSEYSRKIRVLRNNINNKLI